MCWMKSLLSSFLLEHKAYLNYLNGLCCFVKRMSFKALQWHRKVLLYISETKLYWCAFIESVLQALYFKFVNLERSFIRFTCTYMYICLPMFCSVSLQRTRVEGSYQVCQIISTSQGGRTGREKGGEMSLHQLGFFTWLALFDVKNITARSDLAL